MVRHSFTVFADYHQFYVWDAGVGMTAPEDYTSQDVERMVKVVENVVVIQPVRNLGVPVELEVHLSDPGCDLALWDHVVECALALPTGRLQVHECTGGPVLDLPVERGIYEARLLFAGLSTLSADGLDGSDHYRIELWPGSKRELSVVKQWRADGGGHLPQGA